MRIAFVGKGGSGKSTVSAEFCKACLRAGEKVLAIDLDYNMDMSYHLGITQERPDSFISRSRADFYKYTLLAPDAPLKLIADRLSDTPRFDPDREADWYTSRYSVDVDPALKVMTVGPLPESRLYGKECGHVFMSPMRYYLPLLDTTRFVVMDSTAGTDLVSFGMYQGVDAILCVVEPRSNSVRVYEQIKPIAREFGIPLHIFINKAEGDETAWLGEAQNSVLGHLPFCDIYKDTADSALVTEAFDALFKRVAALPFDAAQRQRRLQNWKKLHDQFEAA